jgi:hypothetical protein
MYFDLILQFPCRSNLYIDGEKVVDNDGKVQYATARRRCSPTPVLLDAGLHILFIEGWSSTDVLSITATYQGPDTGNVPAIIPAFRNSLFSPSRTSSSPGESFTECNPKGVVTGERNFTICAYNVRTNLNVANLAQLSNFYSQVPILFPFQKFQSMLKSYVSSEVYHFQKNYSVTIL